MRISIFLALFFAAAGVFAAQPSDTQLDRFFELRGTGESYEATISAVYIPLIKMMNTDVISMKDKDRAKADRVTEKVTKNFSWASIKPRVYDFYKKNYTADEIDGYIKAMSSSGYQKMRSKEQSLAAGYDKMMQAHTLQSIVQIIVETELEEAMKK